MTLIETLGAIERELAGGDGDTYRRLLTDDAVVIVPGMRMTKEECAAAIDDSPRWDELALADERVVQLADDVALLSYRFDGARGSDYRYSALMASVYVRRDGEWRLVSHQQTPLG